MSETKISRRTKKLMNSPYYRYSIDEAAALFRKHPSNFIKEYLNPGLIYVSEDPVTKEDYIPGFELQRFFDETRRHRINEGETK